MTKKQIKSNRIEKNVEYVVEKISNIDLFAYM